MYRELNDIALRAILLLFPFISEAEYEIKSHSSIDILLNNRNFFITEFEKFLPRQTYKNIKKSF